MTREELLEVLTDCGESNDAEGAHADADQALLDFINDPEVTKAWEAIYKWFA